jgi:molybdopterin molybdotransferase
VREALDFLLGAASPLAEIELVDTLEANGRVLAEDQAVDARRAWRRQHPDGWLRRARRRLRRRRGAAARQPAHPGRPVGQPLEPGTAARIFTGALMPDRAPTRW